MTHSAVGELSGLRPRRKKRTEPQTPRASSKDSLEPFSPPQPRPLPPLSNCPNLVSLCLANNELRTAKTALAGLSSLSHLRRLDLSNNFLESFEGANHMLGNVKILILTRNRLRHVRGLDKLYSIETLHLEKNYLRDLSSIAGLGSLPELKQLYLKKNPLQTADKVGYRVRVLNLFKEARKGFLLPNATYRHLLEILPVLDGAAATKREMVGLRELTFRQNVALIAPDPPIQPHNTEAAPTRSIVISSPPRIARVKRKKARRKVILEEESLDAAMKKIKINRAQALKRPNISFTTADVIKRLEKTSKENESEEDLMTSAHTFGSRAISPDHPSEPLLGSFISLDSEDNLLVSALRAHDRMAPKTIKLHQKESPEIILDTVSRPDAVSIETKEAENPTEESPIESDGAGSSTKENGSEDVNIAGKQTDHGSQSKLSRNGSKRGGSILDSGVSPLKSANQEIPGPSVATVSNPFDAVKNNDDESFQTASESLNYLGKTPVAFPDLVWGNDNQSQTSSLGASRLSKENFSSENKYHDAEESSVYDGPDSYRQLAITVNLELYFRCFVFPPSEPDFAARPKVLKGEDLANAAIEASPRIQLRPIDRKIAEESLNKTLTSIRFGSAKEIFKQVWREDVLACGKSASRRVKPQKTPKRAFHGDILFSNGKLAKVCECRKLIICSSDIAIYLISDHEVSAAPKPEVTISRRFPSPIPEETLFQNAIWPHAFARHPIDTLESMTIGFGFQRLALHFRPSSEAERTFLGSDLTYIFTTSSKKRTVQLLKHFQDLVRDSAPVAAAQKAEERLVIDNDDKQFLDSLSAAVQPDSFGTILHYQILQQRWKHGDRGAVRRAFVVTESHIYLLDEDYVGDGSESFDTGARNLGDVAFSLVHSAELTQIVEVQGAGIDPTAITIVIKPQSMLQRVHNWRLVCADGDGAESLVEDVRNAIELS